ncbi:MAG: rod shape-determining protein RodA [Victivallales bacterium]|nr:rod shape-determining protein RodA [Victivallales bacterium]MBT7163064.1 rod shape-determining protein RodA [Victivallales bacterium]
MGRRRAKRVPWYRWVLATLLKVDLPMLVLTLVLMTTGFLFVFGVSHEVGGRFANQWRSHIMWMVLGSMAGVGVALIDYRWLARYSWVVYLGGLGLLLLVFTPMGVTLNTARSWIRLGGRQLQPAELAKPAVLLFTAWIAAGPLVKDSRLPPFIPVFIAIAPAVGLVLMQPDYGTAMVFFPFALAIAFAAGLRWRWLVLGVTILLVAVPLTYRRLKPYQKDRLKVFMDQPVRAGVAAVSPLVPEQTQVRLTEASDKFLERSKDAIHTDWNAHQSLLAVGSGGWFGKGYMKGTQHVLGFLPQTVASSDFVFSVIAEETGFVGTATIVCVFIALILCCLRTALLAKDTLGRYIGVGAALIIFTHVFINVGMTIQAAPIIGIPLPFISHGGSFMIGTLVLMGLVQSVHIRTRE